MLSSKQKRSLSALSIISFLIVLLHLSIAQPAYACTPTLPPSTPQATQTPFTLEAHIRQASFIFEGTVTDGIRRDGDYVYIATVTIDRYIKGSGPTTVSVLGLGSGGDCNPKGEIGAHGIFYTYLDETDQQLHIIPSSYLEPADTQVVATLIGVATQIAAPTPQTTPQPAANPKATVIVAAVGGLILVIALLVVFLLRRKQK